MENPNEVIEETTETTEVVEQVETVEEVTEVVDEQVDKLADIEQRESDLFQKEVDFELKALGLEAFKDVIQVKDAEQLKAVTAQLTAIVNGIKMSVSFVPKENGKQDAITLAEQNKDVKGMLGAKFSKLFK